MTERHLLLKLLLCIMLLPTFVSAYSQDTDVISGLVQESDSSQPAIQAAVMLLSPRDSNMISATVTDLDGRFSIEASAGDYIVKISSLGFFTKFIDIHKTASHEALDLGTIALLPQSQRLNASRVTAKVQPVTIKEDTVVYNTAAYRVAADATLEELVRKIPGMEVTSGGVTLHGRPVEQLLVNGKRFFGSNVRTGLKNLSAEMVENIKAYERESDEARLSGIEDGEAMPVLDITIRKHLLNKLRGTAVAGAGDQQRYIGKLNASKIGNEAQYSLVASKRNNNSGNVGVGVTSVNQIGTGSSGDATNTEAGFTFATRGKRETDLSGSIHYGSRDSETLGNTRSETVNSSSTTFGRASSMSFGSTPSFKASLNAEFHPNKQSSWLVNPTVQYELTRRTNRSRSRSFTEDPLTAVDGDLLAYDLVDDPFSDTRINTTDNSSGTYTSRLYCTLNTQYAYRSVKKKNRSLSIRGNVYYTDYSSDQFNSYITRYFRIAKNPDSLLVKNYYTDLDEKSLTLGLQGSWSEPFGKGFYLQVTTRTDVRNSWQDKNCYNLTGLGGGWQVVQNASLATQAAQLPEHWQNGLDERISYNSTYRLITQTTTISFKYSRRKTYVSAGVLLKPQISFFIYPMDGKMQTTQVNDFNAAPNIVVRYTFNKTSKLSLRYNSRTNTPGISNLMPVVNGTNPLNIRTGNPYLKAPFVQEANLSYNYSNFKRQNSLVCNAQYSMTTNAVSSSCEYDPESGARTYMPKNINGNWHIKGSTALTKTFGTGLFSITNHATGEFRNDANYLYNTKKKVDEINNSERLMLRELFEGSIRAGWFEGTLGGGVNYTDEHSTLRPQMDQHPTTYVGVAAMVIALPSKTRLETDFSTLAQRGYRYSELNKNYYIWNLELSQTVMKHGVLRLVWYDILHSQDNLTRSFTSSRRAITTYNGVCSYLMLRFSYTFTTKK